MVKRSPSKKYRKSPKKRSLRGGRISRRLKNAAVGAAVGSLFGFRGAALGASIGGLGNIGPFRK